MCIRDSIDTILAQDPEDESAILLRGKIEEATGDKEKAESSYQKVTELNPFNEQAFIYLPRVGYDQETGEVMFVGFETFLQDLHAITLCSSFGADSCMAFQMFLLDDFGTCLLYTSIIFPWSIRVFVADQYYWNISPLTQNTFP